MDHIHRVRSIRGLNAVEEVDVLARQQRDVHGVLDLLEHLRVFPRDHVLEPGQRIRLQGLAQPDATVDADVTEVIGGHRESPSPRSRGPWQTLGQQCRPLVGQLDSVKGCLPCQLVSLVGYAARRGLADA